MKTRVRQLANGKWVCEIKRWHELRWKSAYLMCLQSRQSMENGHQALMLCVRAPGDTHYSTMWKVTRSEAEAVQRDILAYAGVAAPAVQE